MPQSVETLFVAWQSPTERSWYTVGRLRHGDHAYRYDYTKGTEQAAGAGFKPFPAFPDLHVSYESERLFPFFANRLLSPGRREYRDFVRWVSPHGQDEDPIALLARSGGTRMTDSLELFPQPDRRDGLYHLHFFVHGLSHMPSAAASRCEHLSNGERLFIVKDVQNPQDRRALMLRTGERYEQDIFFVGYLPRYLSQDVSPVLEQSDAVATVVRVNPPPAPIQFRVLCCFQVRPPPDHGLFEGPEFRPMNADWAASEHRLRGPRPQARRLRGPSDVDRG